MIEVKTKETLNEEKDVVPKTNLLKVNPSLIHPPFFTCHNIKHKTHPKWEYFEGLHVLKDPDTKLPMAIWEPIHIKAYFIGQGFLKVHPRLDNVSSFDYNPEFDPYKEEPEKEKEKEGKFQNFNKYFDFTM